MSELNYTIDTIPKEDRIAVERYAQLRALDWPTRDARSAAHLSSEKAVRYKKIIDDLVPKMKEKLAGPKPQVESINPTEPTEEKVCPKCGVKNKYDSERCTACGTELKEVVPFVEPPPTEMEKEIENMIAKKAALARAVQRAQQVLIGPTGTPPPTQPPQPPPTPEEKKDAFEELTGAIEKYTDARKKFKEIAEKYGYKFEDTYVTRDEHEKGIEEARRKAMEERMDDKSLATIRDIVNHAVDVMFSEGFGPVLRALFARAIEAKAGTEGESPPGGSQEKKE